MPDHPRYRVLLTESSSASAREVVTVLRPAWPPRRRHGQRRAARRGWHTRSHEELLPIGDDPGGALLLGAVAACLLVSPRLWRCLAGSGAPPHALTADGWQQLTRPVS
jgi:hypothetical protein